MIEPAMDGQRPRLARAPRARRYNTPRAMNSRRPSPTAPAPARPSASGASPWRASRERRRDRELKREGGQDGSIAPCDPKLAAFALAGALNWIAHWYREDQSLTGAEIAEAFVAIFEGGLRPRGSASALRARALPARRARGTLSR